MLRRGFGVEVCFQTAPHVGDILHAAQKCVVPDQLLTTQTAQQSFELCTGIECLIHLAEGVEVGKVNAPVRLFHELIPFLDARPALCARCCE